MIGQDKEEITIPGSVSSIGEYAFNECYIDDLANLAANYNVAKGNSNYKSEMDINGDGIIDIYDLVRVANKM